VATRHDKGGALARPQPTADGGAIYQCRSARSGPMAYGSGDSETIERRDEAEIRRIAAQLSAGVEVTIDHGGQVVGTTANGRVEADHAICDLRLNRDGVRAVASGRKEISIGYSTRIDAHGFQREIDVFECALVFAGRCGASCGVRTDGACCATCARSDRPERFVEPEGYSSLSQADRAKLSEDMFAVPWFREIPLHDADHVSRAMARFGELGWRGDEKRDAYRRILGRARALGVNSDAFVSEWGGRLDAPSKSRATGVAQPVTPCHSQGTTIMAKNKDTDNTDVKAVIERLDAETVRADAETARADAAESRAVRAEAQAEELQSQVADLQARLDAAAPDDEEVAELERLTKELERETARADAASDPVKFISAVNARVQLLDAAGRVLPHDRFDELTDHQVRTAVLKKLGSDINPDRADSADYVLGKFEIAMERFDASDRALSRVREATKGAAEAAARHDNVDPIATYAEKQRKRGDAPLPSMRSN
jgi:hypothetical protein